MMRLAVGSLAALVLIAIAPAATAAPSALPSPPPSPPPDAPAPTKAAAETDRRARVLLMIEARPWIRPGLVLVHRMSEPLRLEHSLTAGLAALPDLEVRTTADWSPLGPVRPWLSFRMRRID